MGAILVRIAILALGMGLIETGLTDALGRGALSGWGLVIFAGVPLVLAGTASYIGPLISAGRERGDGPDG